MNFDIKTGLCVSDPFSLPSRAASGRCPGTLARSCGPFCPCCVWCRRPEKGGDGLSDWFRGGRGMQRGAGDAGMWLGDMAEKWGLAAIFSDLNEKKLSRGPLTILAERKRKKKTSADVNKTLEKEKNTAKLDLRNFTRTISQPWFFLLRVF
jgi:hypothetical protein